MSSQYDPRITTYFGDAVMRAGFIPIPHLFMRHYRVLGLTANQAMFLLQIMEGAWDLASPPRTVGDLALRMGVDARTIRRYTEEIAKLGLINLYDQYDVSGAQIENGYDLSPLFARLGELAPEPAIGGTIRREPRGTSGEPAPPGAATPASLPPIDRQPGPGQNDPPPPRTKRSAALPDKTIRARADRPIRRPWTEGSGLKGESRIRKNQEASMMHDIMHHADKTRNRPVRADVKPRQPTVQDTGFSIRHQRHLSQSEVASTAEILRRMGIDQPVRGVVAPSLAPGEAWALWCCAEARRWSTALTVAQVYDKRMKQARKADDLLPRHDAAGEMLVQLEVGVAEELLRLVAAHCPESRDAVLAAMPVASGDVLPVAAEAVWTLMCEARRRPVQASVPLHAPSDASTATLAPAAALDGMWREALNELQDEFAESERVTWLGQSRLVHLDNELAVVGTPNVFVRDIVSGRFVPALQTALQRTLGRRVELEVVINTP